MLSSIDLLQIWERGQDQHPLDVSLTILSVDNPEMKRDVLARLTIGQRDRLLLELHERTFGPVINGFAECPHCEEKLEFSMSINDFKGPSEHCITEEENSFDLVTKELKFSFRLPNSIDLAAIVGCDDVEKAQGIIAQRCVLEATSNGKPVTLKELPEQVVNKLAIRMAECDPQAEILIDLQCSDCSHKWYLTFDIVTFLWKEISTYARRLLLEVHTLASSYGWREGDILSMTSTRRQHYLGLLA